jgi:hypothetical protein
MIRIAQFSDLHYSEKNLAEADRCFGFAVDEPSGAAPRSRSSRATRPTTRSTCTARRSNAWRARCAGWRITVRC